MANPSPRLENLRPPWQPGTSGNPAGYSRGRRISDVIKTQIDELGLTQEFAASAIAVALGYKQILKKNLQDPETGKDIWVELKPDLAWFKLILKIIEPPAQKPDDMAVLNALRAEYDRERRAEAEQIKASESPVPSPSDPGNCDEKVESAGKLFQGVTACVGSGQVALVGPPDGSLAVNPVTNLAVERRVHLHRVPSLCGILALFYPAWHAVERLAFLKAQLAGLCTGGIRRFRPGNIRIRPRLERGLSGALGAIAVVAFFQVNGQLRQDWLPPDSGCTRGYRRASRRPASDLVDQAHAFGTFPGACTERGTPMSIFINLLFSLKCKAPSPVGPGWLRKVYDLI